MNRGIMEMLFISLFGSGLKMPRILAGQKSLLYPDGLTMATIFIGRQGAGKTYALAIELMELFKRFPNQAFFIFDWFGGLSRTLAKLILSDAVAREMLERVIYDPMGGRDINGVTYICPMPEFSVQYDPEKQNKFRVEDQVDRVVRTFSALNPDLIEKNPSMGGRPIKGLLPNLLELANAVTDEAGHTWQLTEAVKLINNEVRAVAVKRFGAKAAKAREYFTSHFKGKERFEIERGEALVDVLDVINSRRVRARVGYHTPAWTAKEAIAKGQMIICDGLELNNNHRQKDYLFLQLFHLVMDEIEKRKPMAQNYQPVSLVFEEVYTFQDIPSASRLLAKLPSQYRNRKVQTFLTSQTRKQIAGETDGQKGLDEMLFSFGNMVVFQLQDIEDALDFSKQLYSFDPMAIKVGARTATQHDIMQNRDEQAAIKAYQIQHLPKRECIVRRYFNEGTMDRIIHTKTSHARISVSDNECEAFLDKKTLETGVELTDALKEINARKISLTDGKNKKTPDSV